ncbi:MAG TPA: UbiH/UbiF family hydroxylase [Rhodocyclaceae bacterium]|nr:UbiH/UbiF family hydroxylase [Rhodocyclaceae bacterium]
MKVDIVIVGGGLAGLALAAALRGSRYSIALVEGRAPQVPQGLDARIYAISPASAAFLAEIGVWRHLDASRMQPVERMEVCGDRSGRIGFSAYDTGVSELAWIAESSLLHQELWETVKRQPNVQLLCPAKPQALAVGEQAATLQLADGRTLIADLVVAADGADSWTRQALGVDVRFRHYEQLGVVANFACTEPHRGTAFQWFLNNADADGILAWLPLPGKRISMVWSTPKAHGEALCQLTPAALCEKVAAAGKHALGKFELLTPPAGFPLRLMRAPRTVGPRFALVGDAAHAIHPLSGHGINLGFQDAKVLADTLSGLSVLEHCGDERCLRPYERSRKEEVVALQTMTDGLYRLFIPKNEPLVWLRNTGMNLTGKLPVLRDALVRYALG